MKVLVTLKGGPIFEAGDNSLFYFPGEDDPLHTFLMFLPGPSWLFEIRPDGSIPAGITGSSRSVGISDSSSSSDMGRR